MIVLWTFLILGGIGLVLGFCLAIADKIFYVKIDTRVEDIHKLLPNYNCGSCGYAGCSGYAQAIVDGKVKKLNQCKPGKPETNFNAIKEYLQNHPDDKGKVIEVDVK